MNAVLLKNNHQPTHMFEGSGNRSRPALVKAEAGREGGSVHSPSQNGMCWPPASA